ncbi:aldehyde dehydrogenase family protein [Pararhizobium mangrovi]|uniref:Aldehyde dehydrogenase family protein n=1 Tax=Pararhizobium mangrovi TaxID=2590452 RepID=A0A506U0B0_9HYPH|nr:aldehyde dehydrogenase family protein [Pararhizobium mangrovi]TPW26996.1 aldehyde dehydrogenase family protein [Pararhizobium mangrovi]
MNAVTDILKDMSYGPAPEDDAIVREWLAATPEKFAHFVDGAFVAGTHERRFETIEPATGRVLAELPAAGTTTIEAAVAAARAAQKGWADLAGHDRAKMLYALARAVQRHARFLAVLETIDNGKPIRETRDIDVPLVARHFYHHAGWAELAADEFRGMAPVGVCAQVIPWNFPLLMLAWKVAPALAAGCTVVLKPAEQTPLSAIAFAEICMEVGLPKGVVNIVQGDGETGAALVGHEGVDKVAFTGSTDVGRSIRVATAGQRKALSLELGGKSPFVVFEDADIEAAVEGVVDAVWFNQGEVCCAGSRLLVHESIADHLHQRLRERMETMRLGNPLDKAIDMGAIVSQQQLTRVRAIVETAQKEGARLFQPAAALPETGTFYPPSLLTNVAPASTAASVEIFGPVLASTTFRTPAEAIALANDTRYGLAASLWSENVSTVLHVAERVEAGVVWINATNLFDAAAPFGGYRESGYGREGGAAGMAEYLKPECLPAPRGKVADTAPAEAAPVPETRPAGGVDRTAKLYVAGKQARPDGGYSYIVRGRRGAAVGEAGLGNRKDIRNAVEAAAKAKGWSGLSGHQRAQILYYLGENLAERAEEFAARIELQVGGGRRAADAEIDASIRRIFHYAAWADKHDARVTSTLGRHTTLAMNEPFGVAGVLAPDASPLLGSLSLALPLLAAGNRIVLVPSTPAPLSMTDFYQVLETSDVPAGTFNIVTGARADLAVTLADHDDVDVLWGAATAGEIADCERRSAGNLKPVFMVDETTVDVAAEEFKGRRLLDRASRIKTIWIPYGV